MRAAPHDGHVSCARGSGIFPLQCQHTMVFGRGGRGYCSADPAEVLFVLPILAPFEHGADAVCQRYLGKEAYLLVRTRVPILSAATSAYRFFFGAGVVEVQMNSPESQILMLQNVLGLKLSGGSCNSEATLQFPYTLHLGLDHVLGSKQFLQPVCAWVWKLGCMVTSASRRQLSQKPVRCRRGRRQRAGRRG